MPGVFISYRRDDSKGFAGALSRELNTRIGDQVFMDTEDIWGGTDFPSALKEAVQSCYVLLAVIGPRWREARDAQGGYRLDDPSDFVRQEISLALQVQVRVIPVLVEGAQMPAADQLPPDLQPLATLNAMELSNAHWDEDVARLTDHIREGLYTLGLAAGAKITPDFFPEPRMTGDVKRLIIASLGFGFAVGAIGICLGMQQARFEGRSRAVNAEVTHMDEVKTGNGRRSYRAGFQYLTTSGQTVRTTSGHGSGRPAYTVGQTISILYDPAHPQEAIINSFEERWGITVIVSGIAGVFLVMGYFPLMMRRIRHVRLRGVLKTGSPVITGFHAVEECTKITVNGRHPFVVLTEWRNPVSRELVHFRSHQVWEDPTEQAMKRRITVVVDPYNFRRYVMDLSFLKTKPKVQAREL